MFFVVILYCSGFKILLSYQVEEPISSCGAKVICCNKFFTYVSVAYTSVLFITICYHRMHINMGNCGFRYTCFTCLIREYVYNGVDITF